MKKDTSKVPQSSAGQTEPPYTGGKWLAGTLVLVTIFIALPSFIMHVLSSQSAEGGMEDLAELLLEMLFIPLVTVSAALGAVSVIGVMATYRKTKSQRVCLAAGSSLMLIGIAYIFV